jgi:hypothetical protein
VHLADEVRRERSVDLLRRQLLEETSLEDPGIVDEHVDSAKPLHGGVDSPLSVVALRDVEGYGQKFLRRPEHLGQPAGVPACRHQSVPGAQNGPREVGAHAAAGTGDEPYLPARHAIS